MKALWAAVCVAFILGTPAGAQQTVNPALVEAQIQDLERQIQELRSQVDKMKEVADELEGPTRTAISDVQRAKKLSIRGYVQARYQPRDDVSQFVVRRARLSATASPTQNSRAGIQIDTTDTVTLKDAYVSYFLDPGPALAPTITMGQFKWPFGFEVVRSSAARETPERAQFLQAFFPGERDKGLKINGPVDQRLFWEAGIFNGSGANKKDLNDRKDVVGRVRFEATDNLAIGASGYWGESRESVTYTPDGQEGPVTISNDVSKNRYGVDFQYYLHNLTFMGEYVTGSHWNRADLIQDNGFYRDPATNKVESADARGYYLQATANLGARNHGVLRYEAFEPDFPAGIDSKTGRLTAWHIGGIRWLDDNSRVKLFYQISESEKLDIKNIWRAEWITTF